MPTMKILPKRPSPARPRVRHGRRPLVDHHGDGPGRPADLIQLRCGQRRRQMAVPTAGRKDHEQRRLAVAGLAGNRRCRTGSCCVLNLAARGPVPTLIKLINATTVHRAVPLDD